MRKKKLMVCTLSLCLAISQFPLNIFAAMPDDTQQILTEGNNPTVIEKTISDDEPFTGNESITENIVQTNDDIVSEDIIDSSDHMTDNDCIEADNATEYTIGSFKYTLNESNWQAKLCGFASASTANVVIPETVTYGSDEYTVAEIADSAFRNNNTITSVSMPNTVITIHSNAFRNCSNLSSINLSTKLYKICEGTFAECTSLTSIHIPKSITLAPRFNDTNAVFYKSGLKNVTFEEGIETIPEALLALCDSLETIVIPDTVTTIGDNAFYGSRNLRSVTLPPNLTQIGGDSNGAGAFKNCSSLNNVILPDKLETIKGGAFKGCTSLSSIVIPNSVKQIGDYAFDNCTSLSSVTLSKRLTKIGYAAFENCTSLEAIEIPKSITSASRWNDDHGIFKGSGLKTVTFEDGITTIPESLFALCDSLEEVTIPDTVTEIGPDAFRGCRYLKKINFSKNLVTINGSSNGSGAFKNCIRLKDIEFPNTLQNIYGGAFDGCSSLTSVTIPDSVTTIGPYAFRDCIKLSSVTLSRNLNKIEYGAFENCEELKSIKIPKNITTASRWNDAHGIFKGSGLKTVTFEEGIETIPESLFALCDSLEEITLPDTVTTIGPHAFRHCTHLKKINFSNNLKTIGGDSSGGGAFLGCVRLDNVIIPDSVEDIRDAAFRNCSGLTTLKLPAGTTIIKENVFNGCQSLVEVTIPANITEIKSNAFAGCLVESSSVKILNKNAVINNSAFNSNAAELTIYGIQNSTAQTYAESKGYAFVAISTPLTAISFSETEYTISKENKNFKLIPQAIPADHTDELVFVSSKTDVATIDNTGKITPLKPGETTITVTGTDATTVKATCKVTIIDGEIKPTAIQLNKYKLSLEKGKDETLTVEFTPETATDTELIWTSKDTKIATVDETGKITAVDKGNTVITVTLKSDSKIMAECEVTVNDQAVKPTAITLNKTTLTLSKGRTATLTAKYDPEDATDTELIWTSKDTAIATVNENGKITAVSKGDTVITAVLKSDDTIKAECSVTVTEGSSSPEPIVENHNVVFYVGNNELKKATIAYGDSISDILPDTAEIIKLLPDEATYAGWYIDGTSTLWDITAPVTKDLALEARYVLPDTKSDQGSGRDPEIIKEPGTSSVVSATYFYDVYMVQGQSYTFPIRYSDIDSSSEKGTQAISWISSDSRFIKVTGKYKAKAVQTTSLSENVYVSDAADYMQSSYCYNIHIVSPMLIREGETASAVTKNMVVGDTMQFAVSGLGEYEDFYDVTWYTSNAEIARVDDGLVYAVGKGTAKISAFVNGKAYTCSVKVDDKQAVPKKIVNESIITLSPFQTANLKFNVTGFYAKNLIWSDEEGVMPAYTAKGLSAEPGKDKIGYFQNNVLRITPAGKVTAIGTGETTLNAVDSKSNTAVEITIKVPHPTTGIIYINKGKSKNIKYYNVKSSSMSALWSKDSVAVLVNNGKVTAQNVGKANVTCSYDPYSTGNPVIYTTTVYVEDPSLDTTDTTKWTKPNNTNTSATLTLKKGERYVIKVNNTLQPAVFTSNKAVIAFADEAGVVEARGTGKATLSARINGVKLTVNVIVTE